VWMTTVGGGTGGAGGAGGSRTCVSSSSVSSSLSLMLMGLPCVPGCAAGMGDEGGLSGPDGDGSIIEDLLAWDLGERSTGGDDWSGTWVISGVA